MQTSIRIADRALESMILAACEAYKFGNDQSEPVETYGHVWGYRRLARDGKCEHIHVDRFNACVSAEGSPEQVSVASKVVELQDSIVRFWSPHLSLLGEFHTHPYGSREELVSSSGWEFSKQDDKTFLADRALWERADDAPISFVMALAPLQRVHENWGEAKAPNRWQFDVGEYRFYLSAVIGRKRGKKKKKKKRIVREELSLELDWRFYNEAGNRVE